MKTDTLDLLDQIYDNAQFGKQMLSELIKHSEDGSFRNALAEQFAQYHGIMESAQDSLRAEEREQIKKGKKKLSRFGDFSAKAALHMNLRIDKTSSHMAEMVMQGCVSNITDIARGIRTFAGAEDTAIELGKKFVALEQENIRRMTDYL